VLVIDDEPSIRTVLLLALEDLFQVVTAATGGEGLTRLQHDPISIVLLDLHLPDLDGFEVLQRIRAFDPQITVFILTGDPDPIIGARAKLLGAVGVLPKPWDIDTLRTQLWQTWEYIKHRLV
jgi:CheY-like chemotaxis protein